MSEQYLDVRNRLTQLKAEPKPGPLADVQARDKLLAAALAYAHASSGLYQQSPEHAASETALHRACREYADAIGKRRDFWTARFHELALTERSDGNVRAIIEAADGYARCSPKEEA